MKGRFRQWRDKKGRDGKKVRGKKLGRSIEAKEKGKGVLKGYQWTDFSVFYVNRFDKGFWLRNRGEYLQWKIDSPLSRMRGVAKIYP